MVDMRYLYKSLFLFVALLTCACDEMIFVDSMFNAVGVDQRFTESIEWNNEHLPRSISTPEESYTLFCMSDSHVGSTDNVDLFFTLAEQNDALCAVLVGDLTDDGKPASYDSLQRHFPMASQFESLPSFSTAYPTPCDTALTVIPIAGNHDLYSYGWSEYSSRFGSSSFTFTITTPSAQDLFICLDSGNGTLGRKQLNWLKDILRQERDSFRHCIVFSHLQFFGYNTLSFSGFLPDELNEITELFLKYNVELAVTGHVHHRSDIDFGNTKYIVMPALLETADNHGYLTVVISGDDINTSIESL